MVFLYRPGQDPAEPGLAHGSWCAKGRQGSQGSALTRRNEIICCNLSGWRTEPVGKEPDLKNNAKDRYLLELPRPNLSPFKGQNKNPTTSCSSHSSKYAVFSLVDWQAIVKYAVCSMVDGQAAVIEVPPSTLHLFSAS